MEDRDRVLDRCLSRYPLNRLDHDFLSLLIGRHLRLLDDLIDVRGSLCLRLILQRLDQALFRLLGRQAGNRLQMLDFLLVQLIQLLFFLLNQFQLVRQVLLHDVHLVVLALELLLTLVHRDLTLLELCLDRLDLGITLRNLFLQIRLQVNKLLLHLQHLVFLDHFSLLLGLFQHSLILRLQEETHP